ncbi:MAG TPA: class I SAM-dependent methyltransferase [Thermoanaerobaculia bacterium]|nr:class I SAM-dependent methyltransferase [Thermoanaerobaculia bacterium]
MNSKQEALVEIGRYLNLRNYRFTTITPESHRRIISRESHREAHDARGVFGWSLPFREDLLPSEIVQLLEAADCLESDHDLLRSTVRFSTVGDAIYAHSAFPTTSPDSVFFGPDTYRFLNLLDHEVGRASRAVDLGCGSGAGGLSIASRADELILVDINPRSLELAEVNASLASIRHASFVKSDLLSQVGGEIDLILANPPYLIDEESRVYRHGGGAFGEALSIRIVKEALERLSSGGKLVLYTGTAVVDGVDTFLESIRELIQSAGATFSYREIDPDVFGEELDRPSYQAVERLAVAGLTMIKP